MNILEKNEMIIKQFIEEAFVNFNTDAMDGLLAANFHGHPWAPLGIPDGPEGMKEVLQIFSKAFSKPQVSVEDIIQQDDKVVVRYIFKALHTGNLMGIEATGKQLVIPGIFIARLTNGKVAEYWRHENLKI